MYANLRAEMYDNLNIKIIQERLNIKFNAKLKAQFGWIKPTTDETGKKLQIIPKKDMPESPDELDSLVLAVHNSPEIMSQDLIDNHNRKRLSTIPTWEESIDQFQNKNHEGGIYY